jgi:hypothetical protein
MAGYRDNTARKEDWEMATQVPHIASLEGTGTATARGRAGQSHDLDDERILMDVQTEPAKAVVVPLVADPKGERAGVRVAMERILFYVRHHRSLAPLSLLAILLVYSLFSPYLPPYVREYMSHIVAGR